MPLKSAAVSAYVDSTWKDSIVPALTEYIRIPNKSPMFDPKWREQGHMLKAVKLIEAWCKKHAPAGATVEVVSQGERTPVIFIEIPGTVEDTILLYGHLDKQPEMTGWSEGLGPWTPVLKEDRLYGRGGADDGYAAFASLTAINAVREQKAPHGRCIVLIEAAEESGSTDLPFYVDELKDRIGQPSLVVCLDAGCGNYDQLWCTTSLRGVITCKLGVSLLTEGVHSGDASGVVADSFRVLRNLLDRLEDGETGDIVPQDFYVSIPEARVEQARNVARVLGEDVFAKFPLLGGVKPVSADPVELLLNRAWRPALAVTGAGGLPPVADAGNVLRPNTQVKLSMRIPPTLRAEEACKKLSELLTVNPPYGAKITLESLEGSDGWDAPPLASWLTKSIESASRTYFDAEPMYIGEGGSIPFMAMLGEKFPRAQFLITGVLGPHSNAHGPNEFLDIPTGRRLTACVASVLADRGEQMSK